jgi:hypothetical protein
MAQHIEGEGQSQAGVPTTIIACATVIEEMIPHLPPDASYEVLDFGLHVNPDALRGSLQVAIDRHSKTADRIILGYGLCSQAVVGLQARTLLWAWNPALLLIFVANGHNDALMIFWLLLGAYFIRRNHMEAGFLLMLLGALVKPIGVLALPLFFVSIWRERSSTAKRVRFLLVTAAGGLLLALISFMPFGSPLELGLRLLQEASAGAGFSPATMLILIGQDMGHAFSLAAVARITLLLFGLLVLWLLWRTWRGRSAVRGTADIYFGYLLQALNFRIWYAAWPFPWLLLDAGTQQREPHMDFRLRYGLWFLLTTQLSVVLYGHIRVYMLSGSQLLAHMIGVFFVFVLPFFLALWQKGGAVGRHGHSEESGE